MRGPWEVLAICFLDLGVDYMGICFVMTQWAANMFLASFYISQEFFFFNK